MDRPGSGQMCQMPLSLIIDFIPKRVGLTVSFHF